MNQFFKLVIFFCFLHHDSSAVANLIHPLTCALFKTAQTLIIKATPNTNNQSNAKWRTVRGTLDLHELPLARDRPN